MSAAENDPARHDEAADPPLTVQLVADLQAGLLDDDTAARVRSQIRTDPQAEGILRALNWVRRDVANAGADPTSAPDIPPALAARISAALSSAGPSGSTGAPHTARPHIPPPRAPARRAGLCAGAAPT